MPFATFGSAPWKSSFTTPKLYGSNDVSESGWTSIQRPNRTTEGQPRSNRSDRNCGRSCSGRIMKTPRTSLMGFALLLVVTATPVSAQTPANPPTNSIDARLAAIEQRLGVLEKQVGIEAPAPAADLGDRLEALDQQIRIVGRQRELDQDAA